MDDSLFDKLIERYQLRQLPKSNHYVGIHRGIGLDVAAEDGDVHFLCFSPTANVGDEILEHFRGFTHWAEAGFSCEWLRGRVEDDSSCVLSVSRSLVARMPEEQFLGIPDVIALDMHAHGAVENCPCQYCEQTAAAQVGVIQHTYTLLCGNCWQEVQAQATAGEIRPVQTVNWGPASLALVGVAAAGAVGWGLLQEGEVRLGINLGLYLFILAFVWGAVACQIVPAYSGGVTFGLRVAVAFAVLVGLLLGNAWGFYAFLRQNAPEVTFGAAFDLYFRVQLVQPGETPYLISGCVGAWLGFALLQSFGHVKVQ